MPTSISPPPERDFPPGHQARRRQQLVSIAQSDGLPSRRRFWVPLAAAASVVALVAGGVVAVQALRSDSTSQVAGDDTTTTPSRQPKPTPKTKPAKPAISRPVTEEITGAELQRFFDDCVRADKKVLPGETSHQGEFQNFDRPLFAFTADWPQGRLSWLVAVRGDGKKVDDRAFCTRAAPGSAMPYQQMLSHGPKGDGYLYQIVNGSCCGGGAGFVMPQVASVTYQDRRRGGAETYAVVRDGMFFYPEAKAQADLSSDKPEDNLILLPGWTYRYRAYDAAGKRIYDSFTDGPFAKDCYTDPTGKEVIVTNSAENPTPETCNRTYEWTAP
jgi:hypothetical protein